MTDSAASNNANGPEASTATAGNTEALAHPTGQAGSGDAGADALEARPAHSSSYPVSRLAPAFHAPDLSDQIGRVEAMLSVRTSAKLSLIADQIRHLQDSARAILKDAEAEQSLHQAACAFERKPGHAYHLYRKSDGTIFWSMLSPRDWHGQPPHQFAGSYRLEADYSWTRLTDAPEE